jgi:hypothetical protein
MPNIFDSAIAHPVEDGIIRVPFDTIDGTWTRQKVETCKRLIRAYKTTIVQDTSPLKSITDSDLWSQITRENFGELLAYVENDDAERLSRFLTHFGCDYVWFGGITTGVDGYNHRDRRAPSVAFSYFDKLVSLGEAIGVLPVENPEQGENGNWGKNIRLSPDEVASSISKKLGINIAPPAGVIPVAGIVTKQGLIHYRHINALYMAMRIRDLTTDGDRIAEFGAGLGLAAFFLRELGRSDITLFDIPITNILSAFFLIGVLGEDAVCLEGERIHDDAIKIRANWNCTEVPDRHFKLIANQDSFPEINRRIFDAYVDQIKRLSSGYLLSINHEVGDAVAQLNVSRLLGSGSGLERISRSPYWLRKGYVEELYKITNKYPCVPKTAPSSSAVALARLVRLARRLRQRVAPQAENKR